jgi:hypothetical protein
MEMTPQVLRWSAGGKVLFPIQRRSDTSHVLSIKQLHSLRLEPNACSGLAKHAGLQRYYPTVWRFDELPRFLF